MSPELSVATFSLARSSARRAVRYAASVAPVALSVIAAFLGSGGFTADSLDKIEFCLTDFRYLQVFTGELPKQFEDEQALLRRLADFPAELEAAARELAPHQITFYLKSLAGEFHSYYNAERILVPDEALKRARLALIVAVRQVLANGLALLGVSAPEKM